ARVMRRRRSASSSASRMRIDRSVVVDVAIEHSTAGAVDLEFDHPTIAGEDLDLVLPSPPLAVDFDVEQTIAFAQVQRKDAVERQQFAASHRLARAVVVAAA